MDSTMLIFVVSWYAIMIIPCLGIGWLGSKFINNLGRYPSKTPVLNKNIIFPLLVIEVVSVTCLLVFFKALLPENL
ncbi:MAG: hypothetical protein Q8Q08_11350 [Candidatus Omnitrophota bacterium]|nr:hypothetical protein [Candidatus Omnitrophota bacterium]MDZ4241447.1 hypothetical protein [Candidatus Omnitrophota bacterium]